MAILWANLIIVYLSSFLARYFSKPMPMEPFVKPNKILIFVSILILVLISGLRNNIGDTFFYMHGYTVRKHDLNSFEFKGDFGFELLQVLLYKISDNPQLLVFTTALITNVLVVLVLYKYSRMIEISLFVFIASGMHTVTMNGIRQSLAAAIVFAATKYLHNGKWFKFILVVLLASTIHQTALIFIPIYFIVRREAWTKSTFIILMIGVGITFGFNEFSKLLFNAIENTKYGHYSNFTEGGANKIRVLITAVPLIIAFFGRKKLKELWPNSDYVINLTTLGVVFMIIASQNWIFARFNIYFGLYNLILFSWILKLFTKQSQKLIYYSLLLFYISYFYYEHVISLNIVYKSDYLIW
ncbi:EpsG family protein [Bacillus sp. OTU2372]|uniref:EpsG family protein n=1 Tax=Bacillus sp. OTU2372 TaxID=3043858 RepID=UPI00313C0204